MNKTGYFITFITIMLNIHYMLRENHLYTTLDGDHKLNLDMTPNQVDLIYLPNVCTNSLLFEMTTPIRGLSLLLLSK